MLWELSLGRLGGDEIGNIIFADRSAIGGNGSLNDFDDAPALESAQRTSLHDLDLVTDLGLVLLVVHVHNGFTIDGLLVTRMRDLVGNGNLDGLVARTAGDETGEVLARIAGRGGHVDIRLGGGLLILGGARSLETGDILTEDTQLVGLLDLTGLLAQAEVKKLFAVFGQLGVELSGG